MPWYDPAFSFKKSFVIPHGNVSGGSDLLDFPLLISFTDSALKSMDNGGLVASSSGYDFLFIDGTETRELPYEVESYTASSGTLVCWVRIPALSASQDTFLYLYFGNGTVTGFQSQSANVWDSHYHGVWHLSETGGTQRDSTVNTNHLTTVSVTTEGGTGLIAGGDVFTASSGNHASASNSSSLQIASSITISAWVKLTSLPSINSYTICGKDNSSGTPAWNEYFLSIGTGHSAQFVWVNASGTPYTATGATVLSTGIWYLLTGIYDAVAQTVKLYVNGVNDSGGGTATTGIAFSSADGVFSLGSSNTLFTADATIDEVKLCASNLSDTWTATEYANQSSPSSFVWIGETIPYAGNVDEALIVASSVTTTQSSLSQINMDSKGAIVTINVTALGVSETFTLTVKGKDGATGQAYTIASFPGIGLGTSAFTVYPGVHDSSTATSAVLPHVWYVTVTPSTSDTASYTVGASLLS